MKHNKINNAHESFSVIMLITKLNRNGEES